MVLENTSSRDSCDQVKGERHTLCTPVIKVVQDRQLLQEIHYWKRLNSSGWMKVCQSKCNLSGAFYDHERRWGERVEKMTHSSWLVSNCSGHAKRLMKSQDWTPGCSLTPSIYLRLTDHGCKTVCE